MASLGPQVNASRMVREYVEQLYEPTAARADTMTQQGSARARALAAWKRKVRDEWGAVAVTQVEAEEEAGDLGGQRAVEVVVTLGRLTPNDVSIQVLHGPVGPKEELAEPATIVALGLVGPEDEGGHYRYRGTLGLGQAGRYGFTVRVVPAHADLVSFAELGCARWVE